MVEAALGAFVVTAGICGIILMVVYTFYLVADLFGR